MLVFDRNDTTLAGACFEHFQRWNAFSSTGRCILTILFYDFRIVTLHRSCFQRVNGTAEGCVDYNKCLYANLCGVFIACPAVVLLTLRPWKWRHLATKISKQ